MTLKVVLLATFFGFLAITLSAPVDTSELAGCDCGTITGALTNIVNKLYGFLAGLLGQVWTTTGCTAAQVLKLILFLIRLVLNILSGVLGLPVPQVPDVPFDMCPGLVPILNEFYKLLGELLTNAEESKRCGCKVPGGLGIIVNSLGELAKVVLGLLGLGGSRLKIYFALSKQTSLLVVAAPIAGESSQLAFADLVQAH
ncbi:hypothetical protein L596_008897 [Steinernema carpocapsae]|uniref:Secreted protein n=1 Tax=Steinernema carpocapsae TaxID=34508 RepID=A0A4V6A6K7_STECR|nr:hypothetical protein L596_008897 [Steinernema carpocapsae]